MKKMSLVGFSRRSETTLTSPRELLAATIEHGAAPDMAEADHMIILPAQMMCGDKRCWSQ